MEGIQLLGGLEGLMAEQTSFHGRRDWLCKTLAAIPSVGDSCLRARGPSKKSREIFHKGGFHPANRSPIIWFSRLNGGAEVRRDGLERMVGKMVTSMASAGAEDRSFTPVFFVAVSERGSWWDGRFGEVFRDFAKKFLKSLARGDVT